MNKNTEPQNINLLTDFGFKRIFGTEQYKKNLIHFLNAFLPPYIGPVTDISYRQSEQLGLTDKEKRLVFDVFCADQNRDNIIVEMQQARQEFLKNRLIAYTSRIISSSLRRGDRMYNYPTVISIILVDFGIKELAGREEFVQQVMLKDDRNEIFSEKMSFLLIDLSKFAARKRFVKLADDREKWCYAIKNMWQMGENDIPAENAVFHELYEECKLTKLTDMEKQEYEKSILEYEDVKEAMAYNRRMAKAEGFEDGFEKGMEKGMEKGRKEGIEEGMEKGRAEGREEALLQTAKKLLELGVPLVDVVSATGLSEEQLTSVRKQ